MKIDCMTQAVSDYTPQELATLEAQRAAAAARSPSISPERIAVGFVSVTTVGALTTLTVDGFGFAAATRVLIAGVPSIRVYYETPLSDTNVGITATASHTAAAGCYVKRPFNANYVDIRPNGATEPTGYCVEVTRINRQ